MNTSELRKKAQSAWGEVSELLFASAEEIDRLRTELGILEKEGLSPGSTGLSDSDGTLICIGDLIKRPVDVNNETHGSWTVYKVKNQGAIPILSYMYSEKGKVLPEGYTASVLSDEYDAKMLLFSVDPSGLRPAETMRVVKS